MANEAFANLTASILTDLSKGGLSGSMNYTPVDTDKWVYTERMIGTTSAELIPVGQPYLTKLGAATAEDDVAATDQYRWLAIKHTGTKDGTTPTIEGVCLCLDDTAAAYNEQAGIFLDVGDLWVGKFPSSTEQQDIHAITVAVVNGSPSAAGTATVLCQIAAIMDDI